MRLRMVVLGSVLAVLSGCAGEVPDAGNGAPGGGEPEAFLAEVEREDAGLPLAGELTLAESDDIACAENVPKHVAQAVQQYVARYHEGTAWTVSAARVVNEHTLLWIAFPEIMDGGVDLIYSAKEGRIVGTFLGGYRG